MAQFVPLVEQDIVVSDAEVEKYAEFVGIDLEFERELLQIARDGLLVRLPEGWQARRVVGAAHIFYWHAASGTSTWEHPNDGITKKLVLDAREQRQCPVATLTLIVEDDKRKVVATSIAGTELAKVEVAEGETYGEVEAKLRSSMTRPDDMVICFTKPDSSLIGFSSRSRLVEELL